MDKTVYLPDIVKKGKTSIKRGPFGSALKKSFFVDRGYKVYEQKNAIKDDFSLGHYYITKEKYQELKGFQVKSGDIIISCSGTIGKIAVAPEEIEEGIINQALLKISLDNNIIITRYFRFWFQNYVNQGELMSVGAAIKNIVSVKELKQIAIPLPPLPEQRAIVAKLDALFERIDTAIALVKENIAHTEALMGSVLDDEFGNEDTTKKLGELGNIKAGGTPSRSNSSYWNGTIPWLTSRELNTHHISESVEKITQKGLEESNAKIFPLGTLLCGMYDTAAMKMSILTIDATCNQAIVGIKPDKEIIDIEFLKFQLESQKPTILLSRRGVRQKNLNASMIKDLDIWVPDLRLQKTIVDRLNTSNGICENVKDKYYSTLSYLEGLKQSLLDVAFKGELV